MALSIPAFGQSWSQCHELTHLEMARHFSNLWKVAEDRAAADKWKIVLKFSAIAGKYPAKYDRYSAEDKRSLQVSEQVMELYTHGFAYERGWTGKGGRVYMIMDSDQIKGQVCFE